MSAGRWLALCALLAATGCTSLHVQWPRLRPATSAPAVARPALDELRESPAADLPAPERVRAESDAFRAIPVYWDPVLRPDVAGYVIERASTPDAAFERVGLVWGRGESAYVDGTGTPTLADGTTAYYRVRCVTAEGLLSTRSSAVVVSNTAPLPAPPRGLRAVSRQPREIPLSWRPSSSQVADGYLVERSPSLDGPYETIATLDGRFATSYVDRGLGNLRVFYYRVSTRNFAGATGDASAPVRGVTKPEPLPPFALRLAESRLGRNTLVWEPNVESDIARYRLYRISKGKPKRLVAEVPATDAPRAEEQVSAGENATYAAVAISADGLESRLSEPVDVDSADYQLEADAKDGRVSLRWRQPEEFPAARILRIGWLGQREVTAKTPGRFEDRDVEPGHSYRYVVVARRADGSEAPASRPLEVHVPARRELR